MSKIEEIRKQYGFLRDCGKELGDKPSEVIKDVDYLLSVIDELRGALEFYGDMKFYAIKNKHEDGHVNDAFLERGKLARTTLKRLFGEGE